MASDTLGGALGLCPEDYAWATRAIVDTAHACKSCSGRVVSALEGGYDVSSASDGLAQAVRVHVRELMRETKQTRLVPADALAPLL